MALPSVAAILAASEHERISRIRQLLQTAPPATYLNIVRTLTDSGYPAEPIAAAALQLHFGSEDDRLADIPVEKKDGGQRRYADRSHGYKSRPNERKRVYGQKPAAAKPGKRQ